MTLFDLGDSDQPIPGGPGSHDRSDADREAAGWFLRTDEMRGTLAFDQTMRSGGVAHEIRLLLRSGWTDLARTARVFERVEREIRRCATAWSTAYEKSSEVVDERIFSSPDLFVDELRAFPRPMHDSSGALQLVASDFDTALSVLCEPELEVLSVLSEWPTATLVYAAASLSRPGEWRWHEHHPVPMTYWNHPSRHLAELQDGPGEPSRVWKLTRWRQLKYRPVSDRVDTEEEGRRHGGLGMVLHRSMPDGRQDVVEVDLGLSQ